MQEARLSHPLSHQAIKKTRQKRHLELTQHVTLNTSGGAPITPDMAASLPCPEGPPMISNLTTSSSLPDNLPCSLAPLSICFVVPPPPPYNVPLHKPLSVCRGFKALSVPTPPRDVVISVVKLVRGPISVRDGVCGCTGQWPCRLVVAGKRDVCGTWDDVVCSAVSRREDVDLSCPRLYFGWRNSNLAPAP